MPISFSLEKYKNRTYIETGLGQLLSGNASVQRALGSNFELVHSIEVAEPLYNRGLELLDKYISDKRLKLYLGDSVLILPKILDKVDWPCTFWLDAHGGYGGGSGVGSKNCPIIEELDIISRHHITTHTILIDDLRIINKEAFDTPGVNEKIIRKKILDINPSYSFSYENGHTANDVLAATPPKKDK